MAYLDYIPPPEGENPIWWPISSPQLTALHSKAQILLYGGASGGGKLLKLNTPIPVPGGWSTIGDLRPGDQVFDERGAPCAVTFISTVEDAPESYRVWFDDGSYIDACADHRWHTFTAYERADLTRRTDEWREKRKASRARRSGGNKSALFSAQIAKRNSAREHVYVAPPSGAIRTTKEILETLKTGGKRNAVTHSITVAHSLILPSINLPLDPYTLGAWLGDGTSASSDMTGIDDQIWQEIERAGFTVVHSKKDNKRHNVRKLKPILRDIGVLGNKHVPPQYLRGSSEQRLSLLQGLMDTDGNCDKDGKAQFCNTNRRLSDAVYELAISLGLKATVTEGRSKLNGVDHGPKWTVSWTGMAPVFRLQRKLDRVPKKLRGCQRWRYIVAVDPIPPVPMRCIAVDSPSHLYLAGRQMVPTHNTDFLVADAMQEYENPNLRGILIRRSFKEMNQIMDRCRAIYQPFGAFYRATEDSWIFPSGARIRLGFMANDGTISKYQGNPFSYLGIDESTLLPENQVRDILPWLATTDPFLFPRARLCTNPGGIGAAWHMKVFLRDKCPIHYPQESVDPGSVYRGARWLSDSDFVNKTVSFILATARDNPLYGQEKIESLNSQTAERRSQLLEGCWCKLEGMYYSFLNEGYRVQYGGILEPRWATHFLGLDYGFSNSAAACGLFFREEPTQRWPMGRILEVAELTERKMGSYDFAKHVCETLVANRQLEGARPQIAACYFDPAMDAHTGTGRSNAEIMGDVFEQYEIPMIKAAKDRIGNAQMAYKMLKSGEFGICDTCPKAWNSFRTRMHDPDLPGAVIKVHGEDLDDHFDMVVYAINTFVDATIKPKEIQAAETLAGYRAAGLDDHSLAIYAAKLSRDMQAPEGPARLGASHGRFARRR